MKFSKSRGKMKNKDIKNIRSLIPVSPTTISNKH